MEGDTVYGKLNIWPSRARTYSTALKGGAGLARQVERAGVEALKCGVQDGHLLPEAALCRGLCGLVEAGACGGEQAGDGGTPALRVPGQTPLGLERHLDRVDRVDR